MSRSSKGASRAGPALPLASDSDVARLEARRPPKPIASGIRLLVSACLLGESVRYDGQHKYDPFLVQQLGRFVEWEPVCPEVDCGMPTPRPSMHLVGDPSAPRLISREGVDKTEQMERFTEAELRRLEEVELCGYVCKKDSPSSGMYRVKVYGERGGPRRIGAGLFTRAFMERFPLIPVEDEGRLHDPRLRESFVERVFCRRRWLDLLRAGRSRGRLVEFHTNHKLLLLAHGRKPYERLGRLVASARSYSSRELYAAYEEGLDAALKTPATARKVTDVLQHMLSHFKRRLTRDEKAELLETIDAYRKRLVPLIVPLTLIRHYVRKYEVEYLARQVFLDPYPMDLMLRNHI